MKSQKHIASHDYFLLLNGLAYLFIKKEYLMIRSIFHILILASFSLNITSAQEFSSLRLFKKVTTSITEPSALSFSSDLKTLWTVSDNNGSAYSLSLDGKVLSEIKTGGSDLEGIVAHEDLEGPCVVLERVREIVCYDKNWKVLKKKRIPFSGDANSGFEGLTYNPHNQHFYIVNEKKPTSILELNSDFDIVQTSTLNFAKDLSDIFFDSIEQKFWILSHESKMIFKTDLSFQIENQYAIPEVVQAEGISVDSVKRKIYVISDKDSQFFVYDY
jgi:uncharacterized protein YjiK